MPEVRPLEKTSFSKEDLIACGHGEIFGPGNARLPLPPMLMMDRITKLAPKGGNHDLGFMEAELEINPDLWFFGCHFESDPVMPGCLGLDALWQMVGFYLGWLGHPGVGRALGAGKIKFSNQVVPTSRLVQYRIDFKKIITRRMCLAVADGKMLIDGELSYEAEDLKVGLFQPQTPGIKREI